MFEREKKMPPKGEVATKMQQIAYNYSVCLCVHCTGKINKQAPTGEGKHKSLPYNIHLMEVVYNVLMYIYTNRFSLYRNEWRKYFTNTLSMEKVEYCRENFMRF